MPLKDKEKRKEYNEQYYMDNKGKIKKRVKLWYKNNLEKAKENAKKYYADNVEKKSKCAKQYRDETKNKEKQIKYINQYRIEHRSKILEQVKEYRSQTINKERRNKRFRERCRTDLRFNLNRNIKGAIRESLKGNKSGRHWESLVDYTLNDLIERLKFTMPKGYTWQDFLEGRLHIDHIIPIRAFEFEIPEDEEFRDCWSLYNLRLLPSEENELKQDKINNPILLELLIVGVKD